MEADFARSASRLKKEHEKLRAKAAVAKAREKRAL